MGNISIENKHLLILDGHYSHVTLDVMHEAQAVELDLITLPSHTSHVLQPLDVSVFKPFKTLFREYNFFWTSRNLNQVVTKHTLVHWVSLGLKRVLTSDNIQTSQQHGDIPFQPRNPQLVLWPKCCIRTN
jgi:hypothetical protein